MEITVTSELLDGFINFKKVKLWEFNFLYVQNVRADMDWSSIQICPYTSGVRVDMDWALGNNRLLTTLHFTIILPVESVEIYINIWLYTSSKQLKLINLWWVSSHSFLGSYNPLLCGYSDGFRLRKQGNLVA